MMVLFQEEAYLFLQMGNSVNYHTSSNDFGEHVYVINEGNEAVDPRLLVQEGYECDEDEEEEQVVDASHYENDEEFARALQDVEQWEATTYLMGLICVEGCISLCIMNHGHKYIWILATFLLIQDAWEDVDPDNMSYTVKQQNFTTGYVS